MRTERFVTHRLPHVLVLLGVLPTLLASQLEQLRTEIPKLAHSVDGVVGVAVMDLRTGDTLTVHGERRFPMQSVYKFPIALAVLDRIERGEFSLHQNFRLSPADLLPSTWSPLREAHPERHAVLTLDSIVSATVSLSDNNGCDVLLRLLGGPQAADAYVRRLGIDGMAIVSTEAEMHRDDSAQYRNYSTPLALARLLREFSEQDILPSTLRSYLWRLMVESPTGTKRLKGLLPASTVVAHKTGSSGTNNDGVAAATNDAGILVLPDGRRVAVVVLVSDSRSSESEREAVIAKIAARVWEAYH